MQITIQLNIDYGECSPELGDYLAEKLDAEIEKLLCLEYPTVSSVWDGLKITFIAEADQDSREMLSGALYELRILEDRYNDPKYQQAVARAVQEENRSQASYDNFLWKQ